MEARPTEFRGITYRSKCEAMFALWLELRNPAAVFDYEPDWGEIENYVVDFIIAKPVPSSLNGRISVFETWVEFVEYKPCRPTFTYLDEVSQKLRNLVFRECKDSTNLKVGAFVYWGSVYGDDRGVATVSKRNGFKVEACNWIGTHEKTIRDFRFDLEVAK